MIRPVLALLNISTDMIVEASSYEAPNNLVININNCVKMKQKLAKSWSLNNQATKKA